MRGEAAADVEQLQLEAARLRLREDTAAVRLQRLDVVLDVGALAADVKAQALDLELVVARKRHQVHGLARRCAELARQLHHRAGVGHAQPQHEAGVRRVASRS